ncbi:hypothetical protein FOL47_000864 [Perkinsus chesapeaki]|uniref:Uncharacterized protein n=1 Tax=Perkinsus chesapeaki TaxID=330153 RepID=A0A7J6ML23_PERCH|nr:hypothetical protein FOL47_000864 [Perkinsus chesapeaki]
MVDKTIASQPTSEKEEQFREAIRQYFTSTTRCTDEQQQKADGNIEEKVDAAVRELKKTLRASLLDDKDMTRDDISEIIQSIQAEDEDLDATLKSDHGAILPLIDEWVSSSIPSTQRKGMLLCIRALLTPMSSNPELLQSLYDSGLAERIILTGLDCREYSWLAGFLLMTEKESPMSRDAKLEGLSQKDMNALRDAMRKIEGGPRFIQFGDEDRVRVLRRAVGTKEGVKALAKGKCSVGLALLCIDQKNRPVVAQGGLGVLLKGLDAPSSATFADTAVLCRQAACQIAASVDPRTLTYVQSTTIAIACLKQIPAATNELEEYEAARALVGITSVGAELRDFIANKGAWDIVKELVFSPNERVQGMALDVLCNLVSADKIRSRFLDSSGAAQEDFRILTAFASSDSVEIRTAATGALAKLLVSDDEDRGFPIAHMASANKNTIPLLAKILLNEKENMGVRYRAASAAEAIIVSEVQGSQILIDAFRKCNIGGEDPESKAMQELVEETLKMCEDV